MNDKSQAILLPAMLLVVFAPLGIDLYLPILPQLEAEFGSHPHEVQLSLSVFVFTVGAGQLFWGPIADAAGRRKTALAGLAFFAAGSLLAINAANISAFYWARFLQGFGAAGSAVVAITVVRDVMTGIDAAKAYGKVNAAIAIIPSVAPLLGGLIAAVAGWRGDFGALALYALVSFGAIYRLLPETGKSGGMRALRSSVRAYGTIFTTPMFLLFSTVCGCGLLVMLSYVGMAPHVLMERMGFSPIVFSLMFASIALLLMAAFITASKVVARLGEVRSVLVGGGFIVAGGLVSIPLGPFTHPVEFLLPVAISAIGFAFAMGSATSLALAPFAENAGKASALLGSMQMLVAASFTALIFSSGLTPEETFMMVYPAIGLLVAAIALGVRQFQPSAAV